VHRQLVLTAAVIHANCSDNGSVHALLTATKVALTEKWPGCSAHGTVHRSLISVDTIPVSAISTTCQRTHAVNSSKPSLPVCIAAHQLHTCVAHKQSTAASCVCVFCLTCATAACSVDCRACNTTSCTVACNLCQ
jgi:hypothetical protein